jgi:hypothetical protein
VETASLAGLSSLSVRSDVRGASVWLDYLARGSVPLDLNGITPGSHVLTVRADGYYDASLTLSLAADTKTTITVPLQLRTGYLDARVSPASAKVVVDGTSYSPGVIELPVGPRSVTVKAFGYREQSFSVFIPERLFASIRAELETAPFEATGFSLSRARFNPRNAGLRGAAKVSFSVSAPGGSDVRVFDSDGRIVRRDYIGPFSDWEQSYAWDGLNDDGIQAPDGSYYIELVTKPAAGTESAMESFDYGAEVQVDSALVVATSGAYGAMYGSAYAPEPFAPAVDGFRIDAEGRVSGSSGGAAIGGRVALSAAFSLAAGVDAGAGIEAGASGTGGSEAAARLGLRVAAPAYRIGAARLGVSGLAEGRVSEAASGDPAYARLGAGLGFGTPFLNLVVMPHVGAYWEGGSSWRAGLGAALNVGGYLAGASLSTAAASGPLSGGFALAWPIRSALELRFSPTGLPLYFRILGGLDWSPAPDAWFVGFGISGGL